MPQPSFGDNITAADAVDLMSMAKGQYRQQEILNQQTIEDNELALRSKARAEQAQLQMLKVIEQSGGKFQAAFEQDPDKAIASLAAGFAQAGDLGKAAELLGKSAVARKNTMQAREAEYKALEIEQAAVESAFSTVVDEESFTRAVKQLAMRYPEDGQFYMQLAEQGYSPELVQEVRQTAISSKERSQIELNRARESYTKQQTEESRVRTTQLIPSQIERNKAQAKKALKNGQEFKFTGNDRSFVQHLIETDYTMEDEQDAAFVLSQQVIDDAKALMESSPTLTKEQAIRKAYTTMQKENRFAGFEPASENPMKDGTVARPLALPLGENGVDATQLLPNRVYQGQGRFNGTYRWDGKQFHPITSDLPDDEDEDEDDTDDEEEE
jgi:hypothetical protein